MAVDAGNVLGEIMSVDTAANAMAAFAQLFIYIVLAVGIVGVIIIIIWKTKFLISYPNSIDIFKIKGGKLVFVENDKFRTGTDRSTKKPFLQLKKRGIVTIPPTFEAYIQSGKHSKLYAEELAEKQLRFIDLKDLLKANPTDYKKFENEQLDRFYKSTQDDADYNKYKKKTDWQKIMEILPILMILMGIGIVVYLAGQFVIIPFLDMQQAFAAPAAQLLEKATELMEAQVRYMEVLFKIGNVTSPLANATYGNESVIT